MRWWWRPNAEWLDRFHIQVEQPVVKWSGQVSEPFWSASRHRWTTEVVASSVGRPPPLIESARTLTRIRRMVSEP